MLQKFKKFGFFSYFFLIISGCSLFYQEFKPTGNVQTETQKKQSDSLSVVVKSHVDEGQIAIATETARNLVKANPGDTSAYIQLAVTISKSNDIMGSMESILMINDLIDRYPGDIHLYLNKIKILKNMDWRLLKSIGTLHDVYEKIIEIEPSNKVALHYLARYNYEMWIFSQYSKSKVGLSADYFERALDYFRALHKYHPTYIAGLHDIITFYSDIEFLASEIPDLVNRAAIDHPDSYELLLDLATYYYKHTKRRVEDLREAHYLFREAFNLMPESMKNDFADIRYLLSSNEIQEWEKSENKLVYAQTYWSKNTDYFLFGWNDREIEHNYRVWYTKSRFSRVERNLQGDQTDRGKYFIRYGPPQRIITVYGESAAVDDSISTSLMSDEMTANLEFERSGRPGRVLLPSQAAEEGSTALQDKYNFMRWYYPDFELKFTFDPNFSDYRFDEPLTTSTRSKPRDNFRFNQRVINPLKMKTQLVTFPKDSTHTQLIVYYSIPIPPKTNIQKPLRMKLLHGLFVHDKNERLFTNIVSAVPMIYPEQVIQVDNDSLYAVQILATTIPNGAYRVSHEAWVEQTNTLYKFRQPIDFSNSETSNVKLDPMFLIEKKLKVPINNQGDKIPLNYHLLPNFLNSVKKGTIAEFFFIIRNSNQENYHTYKVEWSLQKKSDGFFSGIADAVLGRSATTSIEYEYVNKPALFNEIWPLDTKELSIGNYEIVFQVMDVKTRKRDIKTYAFKVVN